MTVTYKGLDCLADMDAAAYAQYSTQLQAAIPWVSQARYGLYTAYFGCAVIGVAFIKHLYFVNRDFRYSRSQRLNWFDATIDVIAAYCRFLGYKPVSTKLSFVTSLPASTSSSLFLIVSSLYLALYCLVPHFWYRGCAGFGSPPLAVRAGLMALALTPFIYILAGKANLITFLTGISYEKLNYIHQYVGVATLALSLVHVIPFIYQDLVEGGHKNLAHDFSTNIYMWSGVPAFVLLVLLCTLSKAWIRKKVYEVFWHAHWVMGIGYFATLAWHTFDALNSYLWIWASTAFWASQVIYRLLVKTCFKPNSLFLRPTKAELFRVEGSQAFQVHVKNRGISWKPGQHVFLRFRSRILDNHPFSVYNLPKEDADELKFLIVPMKGLTKALYDKLETNKSEPVFIDGPYGGCPRDHNSFDKVILLASGSGVTATMPFLTDLSRNILTGKNSITKEIDFVWIVRKHADIDWFRAEIDKAQDLANVRVSIYVCEPVEKLEDNVIPCKPNVSHILKQFRPELAKRTFVCVSGSESMKLQTAAEVSMWQTAVFSDCTAEEVYMHTETFGW